ncbi:Mu-like prophage major head subunit gpT family protein [Escherichia coli]
MIVAASIKALMTSWRKDFQGGLEDATSQYNKIAMVVNSSTRSNTL